MMKRTTVCVSALLLWLATDWTAFVSAANPNDRRLFTSAQKNVNPRSVDITNEDDWICDAGWKRNHRKCYRVLKFQGTWRSAYDHCSKFGGFLAVVDSRSTQLFLAQLLKRYALHNDRASFAWIGLVQHGSITAKTTARSAAAASNLASKYQWAMDTRTLNNYKAGFYNVGNQTLNGFNLHTISQLVWVQSQPTFGYKNCGTLAATKKPADSGRLNEYMKAYMKAYMEAYDGLVFGLPCSNAASTPPAALGIRPRAATHAAPPIAEMAICETRATLVTAADIQASDLAGDFILPSNPLGSLAEGFALSAIPQKRLSWIPRAYWENGVVPYVISQSFLAAQVQFILAQMEDIEKHAGSCIKFVKRSNETDYILCNPHQIPTVCASQGIGRQHGEQKIVLGTDCFSTTEPAHVKHELLHALGLPHEHQRFDRDQHITIHKDNVYQPYWPQFSKIDEKLLSWKNFPYDYESIMHYPENAFAIVDNFITMEAKQTEMRIHLRIVKRQLSAIDEEKLKHLYCEKHPTSSNTLNGEETTVGDIPITSSNTAAASVPATSLAEQCEQLACKTNPEDGLCYAFMDQRRTMFAANDECVRRCATLARITVENQDFLAELVDKQFPYNDTECINRVTMLANQADRWNYEKYGTYTFTMGKQCQSQDARDKGYEICSTPYDCTMVDWLRRSYSICVRPSRSSVTDVQEQQRVFNRDGFNNAWCMKKLPSSLAPPGYAVFVTCNPLPNALNKINYFNPLCISFYHGWDTTPTAAQYAKYVTREFNLNAVRLLGAIYWPLAYDAPGCLTKDGGDCSKDEFKAAPIYGLCRIETKLAEAKNHSQQFAQLWPDGIVPYAFTDYYKDGVHFLICLFHVRHTPLDETEKNALRQAMNDIVNQSRACIKFKEYSVENAPFDYLQLVAQENPEQCGDIKTNGNAGRQTAHQQVFFGRECFKKVGTLYADLLYALGVAAEQTRFDRDEYVNVHGHGYKAPIPGLLSLKTPYDFDSVLHMQRLDQQTSLIKPPGNGESIIEPKNKQHRERYKIGQRTHLSEGDKLKLRLLYGECHGA